MKSERDRVVCFHYELYDEDGELKGSSRGKDAVAALQGHGNVVPGLESALLGRARGERFEVVVPPHEAYGMRREGWTTRVSKKNVVEARRPKVGMSVMVRAAGGVRPVTVLKVGSSVVDVDMNHPLAGHTLRFDVEIVEVREAQPEEIAHGHVHGPGGHGH